MQTKKIFCSLGAILLLTGCNKGVTYQEISNNTPEETEENYYDLTKESLNDGISPDYSWILDQVKEESDLYNKDNQYKWNNGLVTNVPGYQNEYKEFDEGKMALSKDETFVKFYIEINDIEDESSINSAMLDVLNIAALNTDYYKLAENGLYLNRSKVTDDKQLMMFDGTLECVQYSEDEEEADIIETSEDSDSEKECGIEEENCLTENEPEVPREKHWVFGYAGIINGSPYGIVAVSVEGLEEKNEELYSSMIKEVTHEIKSTENQNNTKTAD